jgi:hypothetical protein
MEEFNLEGYRHLIETAKELASEAAIAIAENKEARGQTLLKIAAKHYKTSWDYISQYSEKWEEILSLSHPK